MPHVVIKFLVAKDDYLSDALSEAASQVHNWYTLEISHAPESVHLWQKLSRRIMKCDFIRAPKKNVDGVHALFEVFPAPNEAVQVAIAPLKI
jgi:hypothetical protein